MMNMALSISELRDSLPQTGKVMWIGLRPQPQGTLQAVPEAQAVAQTGLVGDHYKGSSGKRQVTLIQAEHLEAVAKLLGMARIDPLWTRRNIVVSGINLLAFEGRKFQIGEVILEFTGACEPCARMEANLGSGGYNAMQGHGGICTRVVQEGTIRLGDEVRLLRDE